MSLEAFVFLLLGIIVELLWLWGSAHHWDEAQSKTRLIASRMPLHWTLATGAGLLALLAVLVLRLFNLHAITTSLDDALPFYIFSLLGVFIFFAGVIGSGLLPQINEQSIAATQLIVLLGWGWSRGLNWDWSLVPAGAAFVGVVLLALRRKPFSAVAKALLYLWYLFVLILQVYLDRETLGYFSQADLSLPAAFTVGATLVFLVLHGLFSVRFALIALSLIFPKNRALVGQLMPRLFSDDQIPPARFLIILAALAAVLALAFWLRGAPSALLLNGAVLLSVQFLFRTRPNQTDLTTLHSR